MPEQLDTEAPHQPDSADLGWRVPQLSNAPDPDEVPWASLLRDRLAQAPEPTSAARLAEDLLRAVHADPACASFDPAAWTEELAWLLYGLCGVAPFLAAHVRRRPTSLQALLDSDLTRPVRREELADHLEAALREGSDADPSMRLRRFKYFELARISVRDANPDWVPLEASEVTLREISALADVLLGAALEIAAREFEARTGPPRWLTVEGEPVELGFCVLGLGKLGSEELNYSSDVDLVYVYASPPAPIASAAPTDLEVGEPRFAELAPLDYFTRLAQSFGRLVNASGAEGFLYRVDLDLRPEGAQGTIVSATDAFETYYEAWADTWERAAFMKARPVAGDLELGWQTIRRVDPMIYQSSMDYGGVESIRALKTKVEAAKGGQSAGWNLKLDSGGIRDIEFVAQALQLLHGGRIRQVRERGTQNALRGLGAVGLLPEAAVEGLLESYRFLRRAENRLQMEGEQQRHVVPEDATARLRLARAMDFLADDSLAEFDEALERHRQQVLAVMQRSAPAGSTLAESGSERITELFLRNVPSLFRRPSSRAMLEALAHAFARHIDARADPEHALNNLDRFIQGTGPRRSVYELLMDRPELVARLASLFSDSKFLSNQIASHPELIEKVFADPNVLLVTKQAMRADLDATLEEMGEDEEGMLAALRIFQHFQVLNVGLLDVADKVGRDEVEGALTDIAEVCLDAGLEIAKARLASGRDPVPEAAARGRFLIVGMGKLGSRELSYGSDLDLIFLYDLHPDDEQAIAFAQHYFVRLTQRLISALQTPTQHGTCYEIDARLRPSGNQGTLVTSFAAFKRYHTEDAAAWERQALLRARRVAGDVDFGRDFDALRLEILQRGEPADLAAEIDSVRERMEVELAAETNEKRNFKTGRGGILDVETIVQYLILSHAKQAGALLTPSRVETQIERLAEAGWLSRTDADALRAGWDFLQRLGARLRIVENRSISDLDSERGDLEGLALRMGYDAGGREGSARRALLRDYRHHTETIRSIYARILRPGDAG